MKKKNNEFSFFKYYKDSFTTAFLAPVISVAIIVVTLLVLGYEKQILDLKWLIILSILLSVVLIGSVLWFVLATLHAIVKQDKENSIVNCKTCSMDYKKYIFYRHELISLEDICQLEKNLADHPNPELCEVYNYTTLNDTFISISDDIDDEDKIENIISRNRSKGVVYKVFFIDPSFVVLNGRNQKIYGEENLLDCTDQRNIYNDAEFDFLIHRTPETITGYAAVNFTSHNEKCGTCPHKPCDYKNENQFYRILSIEEATHVYRYLMTIIAQHEGKE